MAEMNQRVGGPYGDIVIVNTPQLDRLGQQFYQQDLKRKKENEAAAKAYDKELQNDLTKVRPADIPDNVKLYNDYKLARINLLKKGDKATPLDHQAVLQKQADYFRHTNDSIREKQLEQDAQKRVLSKPDDFNENANSYLADRRKRRVEDINTPLPLPTSIRSGTKPTVIDESDIYSIIKNPDDNNDYSKYVLKARGEILPRGEYTRKKSPDGLTTQVTQYKAGNSPDEYLMHLQTLGDKTLNGISKKFNYSDEEAQKIMDDYNALKETPAFKASFPNQREISPELLKTKRGRNLALMAMENALMHPPTPVTKSERNLKAIEDAKNAEWRKRNAMTFKQSMAKIAANKGSGGEDENGIRYLTDEYVAKAGETRNVPFIGETTYVPVDKIDAGDLAIIRGNGSVNPVTVGDKKYFKVLPNGDWEGEDGKLISRDAVLDRYLKGKPKLNVQLGSKAERTQEKKITTNDNSYSKKELLENGWNEDQIKKAVKAGAIKLK